MLTQGLTPAACIEFGKARPATWRCRILPLNRIKPAFDAEGARRKLIQLLEKHVLTPNEYDEQKRFVDNYSQLRLFAECHERDEHFSYVFGMDPEIFNGPTKKKSRGEIFRWNGEIAKDSFEPVAPTFSDWLESLLTRLGNAASTGKPAERFTAEPRP